MTENSILKMDIQSLLDRYVQLSVRQGVAADLAKIGEVNRLGALIRDIHGELKRRPGDQRRALAMLFDNANAQVRFNAAVGLMSIVPSEARRQIQAIADSKQYPLAGHAGMYLFNLDNGFLGQAKPD